MKTGDLVEFRREGCSPGAIKCYPHLTETGMIIASTKSAVAVMFPSGIKKLAKGQIRKVA